MVWIKRKEDAAVAVMTAGICCLGSYILTCLCEQFRLCALGQHVSKVLNQKALFCLMALSLGGVSIFSMNFLNLSGVSAPLPASATSPAHNAVIAFRVIPVVVSLVISTAFAFLGLYVASRDPMFAKTKKQIIEGFILDSKDMTLKEVKAISSFAIFYVISTKSLGYLALGGVLTGSGAAVTACLTMWSITAPELTAVWDGGVIVADILFSWFFSTVSFWILFRLLSLYPRREILRVVSSLFMAFCFVSTHFVAVTAIKTSYDLNQADHVAMPNETLMSQSAGFLIILVAVVIFCFLLLMLSIVDMRSWLHESSAVTAKHEAMLMKLKAMHTDNYTLIACYMKESGHGHSCSHGNNQENSTHSQGQQQAPSLLERNLTGSTVAAAASSAAIGGTLWKYMPIGKGKVTPRAILGTSSCSSSSPLPESPSASTRWRRLTPWTPRRVTAEAVVPSEVAQSTSSPVLCESEGAARYTDPPAVASSSSVLSLRLPSETEDQ